MAKKTRNLSSVSKKKRKPAKLASVRKEDIDILLRLAELYNTGYDFEAAEWFWGQFREPTTFEDFRNKYPQGSNGAQLFERFTSKFELAGILIEYGFLDEGLYFDRYGGVQTEWESTKSTIYGIRKEWNDPRFRENFEILATRGIKWLENHPPKLDNDSKT